MGDRSCTPGVGRNGSNSDLGGGKKCMENEGKEMKGAMSIDEVCEGRRLSSTQQEKK